MMPDLKLGRLPERRPIKLAISISPDLHFRLEAYARLYEQAYGSGEPVTELIPAMLMAFLDSDRAFVRGLAHRK